MKARGEVHRAEVYLGAMKVGELRCEPGDVNRFVRERAWFDDPTHPLLGQWFEDHEDAPTSAVALPTWFSNLVPEGPLREVVAEQVGVRAAREFWLLTRLGEDLPGNVRVVPRDADGPPALDGEPAPEPAVIPDDALRFSLAGVQMKFSALRDDRGVTVPVSGRGGDWILKLPDQRFAGVPENEWSMLHWAEASGIAVPEHHLVEPEDVHGLPVFAAALTGRALLVRRFDRTPAGRVHQEDFAQVLDVRPAEKYERANYETLVKVTHALCPEGDVDELLRRLAFMVLCGNGDAHLKNFSLTYPDGRAARVAPAYDLVCTRAYIPEDSLALKLGDERRFSQIGRTHFRALARRTGVDEARVGRVVSEFVERARSAWAAVREELPAAREVRATIDAQLAASALMR